MKLLIKNYGLEFTLLENMVYVLYLESKDAYSDILNDFWSQVNGGEGKIVLSDCDKDKKLSKELVCIFNPFDLDCNDRKILTRLYQEIKSRIEEKFVSETSEMHATIMKYLDNVLASVPYALEYNLEFDITNFLKMNDVKNDVLCQTLLEKIVEYIRIMHQICMVNYFLFVNLKAYLSEEELQQLYEFCFYNKIYLILIESRYDGMLQNEKGWIIDQDLCIIELN